MRVLDQRSPYREVDPEDVVVIGVEHTLLGRRSAYGCLRSEMTYSDFDTVRSGLRPPDMPGPTYRVAYLTDDGLWQAEGTVDRELPPESIMRQIESWS